MQNVGRGSFLSTILQLKFPAFGQTVSYFGSLIYNLVKNESLKGGSHFYFLFITEAWPDQTQHVSTMSLAEEPPMQLASEMFNSEFPFPSAGSTTQEAVQYYAPQGDAQRFVFQIQARSSDIPCSLHFFANSDLLHSLLKTMLIRLDGIDKEISRLSSHERRFDRIDKELSRQDKLGTIERDIGKLCQTTANLAADLKKFSIDLTSRIKSIEVDKPDCERR